MVDGSFAQWFSLKMITLSWKSEFCTEESFWDLKLKKSKSLNPALSQLFFKLDFFFSEAIFGFDYGKNSMTEEKISPLYFTKSFFSGSDPALQGLEFRLTKGYF